MMPTTGRDLHGRFGMVTPACETGGPVVFCEGGLAAPVELWSPVVDGLRGRVHTVVTERQGTFRSARARGPRTVPALATELGSSIRERAAGRPVILVAEGFGGLIALETVRRDHAGDLIGVVLIDSLHPEALSRSARQRQAMARLEATLTVDSLMRRLPGRGPRCDFDSLPPAAAARVRRSLSDAPWTHGTAVQELRGWKRAVTVPVSRLPATVALSVLSSGTILAGDPSQAPLQEALAGLSATSRSAVLPDGASLLAAPSVAVVVQEVLGMVEERAAEHGLGGTDISGLIEGPGPTADEPPWMQPERHGVQQEVA